MSKKHGKIRRWYHASPRRFKKGALLARNGAVFMTDSPVPHYTILPDARHFGWHVYEVRPLAKIYFGLCWDEAITDQAEVVQYIGTARGIAAQKKNGSKVLFAEPRRDCDFNPGVLYNERLKEKAERETIRKYMNADQIRNFSFDLR